MTQDKAFTDAYKDSTSLDIATSPEKSWNASNTLSEFQDENHTSFNDIKIHILNDQSPFTFTYTLIYQFDYMKKILNISLWWKSFQSFYFKKIFVT